MIQEALGYLAERYGMAKEDIRRLEIDAETGQPMRLTVTLVVHEPTEVKTERLTHGAATLEKVRTALYRHAGLSEDSANEIISEMQKAGILFRERRPAEVKVDPLGLSEQQRNVSDMNEAIDRWTNPDRPRPFLRGPNQDVQPPVGPEMSEIVDPATFARERLGK